MAATATAEKPAKAPPKEKPVKPVRPPRKILGGYERTAKISFTKDEEGVLWGPGHNPHRSGTNLNRQFALLRAGMTIQQALDAGVWPQVLRWIHDKGFIELVD